MIDEIIGIEWDFFQNVNNIGGRADCQDDFDTFYKQRFAQFKVFYPNVLESYLNDLKNFCIENRNPLTEKYAYMMKFTDYSYYLKIKDNLIELSIEQEELIDTIVSIEVNMRMEMNEMYPYLSYLSRKTHSSQDNDEDTSFETYLRGELSTYSFHTLYLYGQMILDMLQKNENIVINILKETVKLYGYSSIEEAENFYHND